MFVFRKILRTYYVNDPYLEYCITLKWWESNGTKRVNACIFVRGKLIQPSERQPHKIVKHIHTICRKHPTNCLSEFDHFVGLALKGLSFLRVVPKAIANLIILQYLTFLFFTKSTKEKYKYDSVIKY